MLNQGAIGSEAAGIHSHKGGKVSIPALSPVSRSIHVAAVSPDEIFEELTCATKHWGFHPMFHHRNGHWAFRRGGLRVELFQKLTGSHVDGGLESRVIEVCVS